MRNQRKVSTTHTPDDTFPDLEERLRPLAEPLEKPRPGDWLAEHHEKGQTFRQYLACNPVRRDRELKTIYLCVIGECDPAQQSVFDLTREFLSLFFDSPVVVRRTIAVADIPNTAKRKHPTWGDRQLLTSHILHAILEPDRPDDALAYLALTTRDLWPGDNWNFVYGQANLRQRVGVWSIYRNGYPGTNADAFKLCLRRTLMLAAHETGHILTMMHCTAHRCLMNGCNHSDERDSRPLNPCPVCLRKLMWNLQVNPPEHLRKLAAFCASHDLAEAGWFTQAAEVLEG